MKTLTELFDGYREAVTSGERPETWPSGLTFGHLVLAPGRVVVIAGPPGVGKSAAVTQVTVDALLRNPHLTAYLVNVEMSALSLVHRIVARLAEIDLGQLSNNAVLPQLRHRLDEAIARLEPIAHRLLFGEPPFEFGKVVDEIESTNADLIILDYVQRLPADPGLVPHTNERTRLEGLMNACRGLAQRGKCVVVVSALNRARDDQGRASYMNLRGSSELEFGADDVAILVPVEARRPGGRFRRVRCQHEKSRYGATVQKELRFCGATQEFTEAPPAPAEPHQERIAQLRDGDFGEGGVQ
jgi:replicative DNA helicase